jgi:WD40 repeat protein
MGTSSSRKSADSADSISINYQGRYSFAISSGNDYQLAFQSASDLNFLTTVGKKRKITSCIRKLTYDQPHNDQVNYYECLSISFSSCTSTEPLRVAAGYRYKECDGKQVQDIFFYKKVEENWEEERVKHNQGPRSSVNSVAFAPSANLELASGLSDHTIRLWRYSNNGEWELYKTLERHKDSVNSVAYYRVNETQILLASGSSDKTVLLWQHDSGEWECYKQLDHEGIVKSIAFCPSPFMELASASSDTVRLWSNIDRSDECKFVDLQRYKGEVNSVAFGVYSATDTVLLASGSSDNTVRIWCRLDPSGDYDLVHDQLHHSSPVHCVGFSSDTDPVLASLSTHNIHFLTLSSINVNKFSLKKLLSLTDRESQLYAPLDSLNGLVGIENVKEAVAMFAAHMSIRAEYSRGEWNNISLAGPPGTGKTLLAGVLGNILAAGRLVKSGAVVDMSIADLKAGYIGQTFEKTTKFLERNQGRVLFLDEANTLFTGGQDYGREAASAMIKFLESERNLVKISSATKYSTVIIVAGYKDNLEEGFWAADPGLKRRFPHKFSFDDYTSYELVQILLKLIQKTPSLTYSGSKLQLFELIQSNNSLFSSRDASSEGLSNGGGMEVLLQRAQFCRAAAMVVSHESQNCKMRLTFDDFDSAMKLILGEGVSITVGQSARSVATPSIPTEVGRPEVQQEPKMGILAKSAIAMLFFCCVCLFFYYVMWASLGFVTAGLVSIFFLSVFFAVLFWEEISPSLLKFVEFVNKTFPWKWIIVVVVIGWALLWTIHNPSQTKTVTFIMLFCIIIGLVKLRDCWINTDTSEEDSTPLLTSSENHSDVYGSTEI